MSSTPCIRPMIGEFVPTTPSKDISIRDSDVNISYWDINSLFTKEETEKYQIRDGLRCWSKQIKYWCEYSDGWQYDSIDHVEYYTPLELIQQYKSHPMVRGGEENIHLLPYNCSAGYFYKKIFDERYPALLERKKNELRDATYQRLLEEERIRHIQNEEEKNQPQYRQDIKSKIEILNYHIQKVEEYRRSDEYLTLMRQYSEIQRFLETHTQEIQMRIKHYQTQQKNLSALPERMKTIFGDYSITRQNLETVRIRTIIYPLSEEIRLKIEYLEKHLYDYIGFKNHKSLMLKHSYTSPDYLSSNRMKTYREKVQTLQNILRKTHITHPEYIQMMDMEIPNHVIFTSMIDYRIDDIIAGVRSNITFVNLKDYTQEVTTRQQHAQMKAYRISMKGRFNRWILRENQYLV